MLNQFLNPFINKMMPYFWQLAINPKFNNFLLVCWFLCKILYPCLKTPQPVLSQLIYIPTRIPKEFRCLLFPIFHIKLHLLSKYIIMNWNFLYCRFGNLISHFTISLDPSNNLFLPRLLLCLMDMLFTFHLYRTRYTGNPRITRFQSAQSSV